MTEPSSNAGALIDVSTLPRHAVGTRAPLWWGTVLLVAIEATCFAVAFNSYLYIRNNFDEWPPNERLRLLPGIVPSALLVSSLVPTWLYRTAAFRERFAEMRRWLVVATVLAFACCIARAFEIYAVPFPWTGNAYASVVWVSLGMHTVEIVTGAVESAFLCYILFRPRVEMKSFEDVEASALFWFFSVLVWLPFSGLFYLEGQFK